MRTENVLPTFFCSLLIRSARIFSLFFAIPFLVSCTSSIKNIDDIPSKAGVSSCFSYVDISILSSCSFPEEIPDDPTEALIVIWSKLELCVESKKIFLESLESLLVED